MYEDYSMRRVLTCVNLLTGIFEHTIYKVQFYKFVEYGKKFFNFYYLKIDSGL